MSWIDLVVPHFDLDEGTWFLRQTYKRHLEAVAESALSEDPAKLARAEALGRVADMYEDRLTELRNAARRVPVG